jgi:hypothetical protein
MAMGHNLQDLLSDDAEHSKASAQSTSRSKADSTRPPKLVTSIQPVTEVIPYQYEEAPIPHGHPQRDGDSPALSQITQPSHSPNFTPPVLHEPRQPARKLKHMESTRFSSNITIETKKEPLTSVEKSTETLVTTSCARGVPQKQSTVFAEGSRMYEHARGSRSKSSTLSPQQIECSRNGKHIEPAYLQKATVKQADKDQRPQRRTEPSHSQEQIHNSESIKPIQQPTTRPRLQTEVRPRVAQPEPPSRTFSPVKKPSLDKIPSSRRRQADEEHNSSEFVQRTAFNSQNREYVPKGRVSSPPLWLKTGTKQAASIQAGLRHVNAKSHNDLARLNVEQTETAERPRSSVRRYREARNSFSRLSTPGSETRTVVKPSPLKAKQDLTAQDSSIWLGRRSELQISKGAADRVPSQNSALQERQKQRAILPRETPGVEHAHDNDSDACISHIMPTPTSLQKTTSHRKAAEHNCVSPSTVTGIDHLVGQFSYSGQDIQENYRRATLCAEAELERLRTDKSTTIQNGSPNPPTTPSGNSASGLASSPLQPRQVSFQGLEKVALGNHTLNFEMEHQEDYCEDGHSELEIHRPTPIAPPNHECSWKERYMALTAEIRLLKAEMSTRPSEGDIGALKSVRDQGSPEEDDLGIQGLTIVMHIKGKDDLVINTDLTQDTEEE